MESGSSSCSEQYRNWLELPRDVTASILQRLGAIEILTSAQHVCKLWYNLCKDPSMWRTIEMHNLDYLRHMPYKLEKTCRNAVDRSSGQLRDINLEYFVTDDLLNYIANSSSQLRRVRLVSCNDISDGGLSEAAAKLPLLEELELSLCSLSKEPLVAVGCCCPLLKSLKLNHRGYRRPYIVVYDEEVLAIAENMPELRHLQLFGNTLTNDGLLAILDGCPHLESLDLRKCYNVTLSGNLGRRCTEGIKELRLPNDSTDDYELNSEMSDSESVDEDYPLDFDDFTNYHEYYESSVTSDSPDYGFLWDGDLYY